MSAALHLSPRSPSAVHARQGFGLVAVSDPEPIMTLDARLLMHLGCACRRATASFALLYRRMDVEIRRGERVDNGEMAETAAIAGQVEKAAQVLQDLSQDADLLTLLPYRARFAELRGIAEAMERGTVFVPVDPAPVVVAVEQDAAARPVTLVQRLGRVARRFSVFRMAA